MWEALLMSNVPAPDKSSESVTVIAEFPKLKVPAEIVNWPMLRLLFKSVNEEPALLTTSSGIFKVAFVVIVAIAAPAKV